MTGFNTPPRLSALPFAVPRSALPGIMWPALSDPAGSRLLALQFQFGQSQWWPPELIEARQRAQLQQVLAHAQRTVPFYADRLPVVDPHAPDDPERWMRIPILTRQDVQRNKDGLLSRAVPPQHGGIGEIPRGPTGKFEEFVSQLGT